MSKDNGGPAFPADVWNANTRRYMRDCGVTTRDYFAAKALQGLLADPNLLAPREEFAQRAYELADAMLAERSKP